MWSGPVWVGGTAPLQATEQLESLIELPHDELVSEDQQFWPQMREEVCTLHLRGSALSDALLVALLKTHGADRYYTHDSRLDPTRQPHTIHEVVDFQAAIYDIHAIAVPVAGPAKADTGR